MSDDNNLGNNLFTPDEDTAAANAANKPRKAKKKNDEERQWIVLEDSDDIPPTGLSLGVNGEVCMVLPGEPVNLPLKYIEVLNHAIISVPIKDSTKRVIGHRERHRFPYRLVDPPAAAE